MLTSRYTYDHWLDGVNLYVKVTALQWERATEITFNLQGRRYMRRTLENLGYDPGLARGVGGMVEWDRSHNVADLLTDSVTYRLVAELPEEAVEAA